MKYLVLCAFFLQGCALTLNAALQADGACAFELDTRIQPKTAALLQRLNTDDGGAGGIDAAVLNAALRSSPFVQSAELVNAPGGVIRGAVRVADLNALAKTAPAGGQALTFTTGKAGAGGGSLFVRLNRATGGDFLAALSRDLADYVSALLAPIATGEELTEKEYLALIGEVYGKNIAAEIAASTLALRLRFPASLKSARGLNFTGAEATLKLPLASLLVLEHELLYEAVW